MNLVSQSAPAILVLKTWVGLWPWKKSGQKYGIQKAGCKKQGHCYSKREEAAWPLLFLNNNDPVFLHPAFCKPYFGRFFTGWQTDPCFQNKNSGCRMTWQTCDHFWTKKFQNEAGVLVVKSKEGVFLQKIVAFWEYINFIAEIHCHCI